jgi:hypothetical protein
MRPHWVISPFSMPCYEPGTVSCSVRMVFEQASLRTGDDSMGLLRGGLAGLAAWKWGGGCLGTIIVFVIVYLLLGVLGLR